MLLLHCFAKGIRTAKKIVKKYRFSMSGSMFQVF